MELHGIQTESDRKEITCSDCGHVYVIARGQRSGTCSACGNVEFLDDNGAQSALGAAFARQLVESRVMPRLRERARPADPLAAFRTAPDGIAVEALRQRLQVEWQLWSHLVKHFDDPVSHMAYLCQATTANELERAADRYREHRSVMLLLADSHWQAEVADLMLARVEAIAVSRLAGQRRERDWGLPDWLRAIPYQHDVFRLGWIGLGLYVVARIFHAMVR